MTPREELLRGFDTLVDNYHASRQETRAMLDTYAIGRWVSVDERLPHMGKGEWRGYAKFKCGAIDIVTWHYYQTNTLITHWLELNLPENHNE